MEETKKKLTKYIRDLQEENAWLWAGVKEINRAVDVLMVAVALDYGAKLPDGGRVVTIRDPKVELLDGYTLLLTQKSNGMQITVRNKQITVRKK